MARIQRALGVSDAARGLYNLNVRLGLPTGLKGLGLREEDIGKAVDIVAAVKISHPRPVSKTDLAEIIRQAFFGEPPRF
jgi:alcohol dehydrogenase class IV